MGDHIESCLFLKTGKADDCHCADESRHYLGLAKLSFLAFVAQASIATVSGSLALLADTIHIMLDGIENMLSMFIATWARRVKDEKRLRDYGGRISLVLIALAGVWILYEAYERLAGNKETVIELYWALVGAAIGLAINIRQYKNHAEAHTEHKNVTHRRQHLHLVSDIAGSVAAITGLVFVFIGYPLGDAIASLCIVAFIWFRVIKTLFFEEGHGHHHGHHH